MLTIKLEQQDVSIMATSNYLLWATFSQSASMHLGLLTGSYYTNELCTVLGPARSGCHQDTSSLGARLRRVHLNAVAHRGALVIISARHSHTHSVAIRTTATLSYMCIYN